MDSSKIALSGISAANQMLSNTSNNLANSETTGYKGSSVTFSELVVNNGSQGEGIGVSGGKTTINFSSGTMSTSSDPLDHAISGDGFFIVEDDNGSQLLTRGGDFSFDADGVLVDSTGNAVQGYLEGSSELTDIVLISTALPPEVTSSGELTANFGSTAGDSVTSILSVFDSLGAESDLAITIDSRNLNPATNEATWTVSATINGNPVTLGAPSEITFNSSGQLVLGSGLVDASGKIAIDLSGLTPSLPGVTTVSLDISKSTGYEGDSNLETSKSDGRTYAEFTDYAVEEGGTIVFNYRGGETKEFAQIAMAVVENLNGLVVENNGYYTLTQAAGDITYGVSGDAGFGTMYSGYLEGSNVDNTAELVSLISAQKFYQSNSKVLGVVDENNKALMQVI